PATRIILFQHLFNSRAFQIDQVDRLRLPSPGQETPIRRKGEGSIVPGQSGHEPPSGDVPDLHIHLIIDRCRQCRQSAILRKTEPNPSKAEIVDSSAAEKLFAGKRVKDSNKHLFCAWLMAILCYPPTVWGEPEVDRVAQKSLDRPLFRPNEESSQ